MTRALGKIARELRMVKPGEIRLRFGMCPLCGWTAFLKRRANVMATCCVSCRATPIAMGMVLAERVPVFRSMKVYELSSRGPFFHFLAREVKDLTCSEYFDDVPSGMFVGGIQCQDVQQLSSTVPLHDAERTVERARIENGVVIHHLPPEYHEDHIRGSHKVLVYRDYGRDIVERLSTAGFHESEIVPVRDPSRMGHTPNVVFARKK